jgi:hypothetical protein
MRHSARLTVATCDQVELMIPAIFPDVRRSKDIGDPLGIGAESGLMGIGCGDQVVGGQRSLTRSPRGTVMERGKQEAQGSHQDQCPESY